MVSKKQRKDNLLLKYTENISELNRILMFLKNNSNYPEEYNRKFTLKVIGGSSSLNEKLRALFISTMSSGAGRNLTATGKSAKNFFNKTKQFGSEKGNFKEFLQCFDKEITDFSDLFEYFTVKAKKDFPHLGKKKTALFIRDLNTLNDKLFTNYAVVKGELRIPVDIVISIMLNKIMRLSGKDIIKAERDFDLVNEFAKKAYPENPLLIEDLWFWGYFNQTGAGHNRVIGFNEDKYYSDQCLFPQQELENKFKEFSKLVNKE
ncbi:MAG: hypothetical protein WCI04_02115 [archaeon]